MTGFPGPNPVHGDTVQLIADTLTVTITGKITSRGVLHASRGYVELVLPDGDPQQRRALEQAAYQYRLFHNGTLLYASPHLHLHETRRESSGALVVTGSP